MFKKNRGLMKSWCLLKGEIIDLFVDSRVYWVPTFLTFFDCWQGGEKQV